MLELGSDPARMRNSNRLRPLVLLFLSSLLLAACGGMPRQTETLRRLIILHTNDEHGWMDPYKGSGGAAGLMRLWERREGYTPDGPYLIVSSGDMWTGPAVSTTLAGGRWLT
jgi:2',3'-cyclic-nucleotide 2'-phosphodiesterase (5'-nucleotidase family)